MSQIHQITTLPTAHHDHRLDLTQPTLTPHDIPPGVQWVILPDGTRTLAYTPTPQPGPVPASSAPVPAQPVPAWAKTTALLVPTVGGGVTAAGYGISAAAQGVAAMTPALWATAALIATGGLAAALRGIGRRTAARTPHITQHITATGLFGRATGTINHH